MPNIRANNIDIYYEENGPADAPVILLVMGLGAQMIAWPDEFIHGLVGKGYRVIHYDNRDVGMSQRMDGAAAPNLIWTMFKARIGLPVRVPYTLGDMAADGIGLLDALGIDKAHVVGASMGGMIVQLMAANHPERTLSLTSIMSSSGKAGLPGARADIQRRFMVKRAPDASRRGQREQKAGQCRDDDRREAAPPLIEQQMQPRYHRGRDDCEQEQRLRTRCGSVLNGHGNGDQ